MEIKTIIFVAMSGGVDSSVAAALLKKVGFDVVGVYMKQWSDPVAQKDRYGFPVAAQHCASETDAEDARCVAEKLGIPFYVWDFEEEYKARVAEYMIGEYAAGRTPNPDVMCNKEIKFGLFLERARTLGADFIATGHYARREAPSKTTKKPHATSDATSSTRPVRSDRPRIKGLIAMKRLIGATDAFAFHILKMAEDKKKDQTYFLWTLTQKQLQHCLFPIGDYVKSEVRELARKFGLPTAEKKDSQGLCFVGQVDMQEFLRQHISGSPGAIVTSSGETIGRHEGLPFYTIGQRHGIEIGGGIPYYVADKNPATNTLVVAEGPYDDALFRNKLTVHSVNWISGKVPKLPLQCEARIRYRQPLQKCQIMNAECRIKDPEKNKEPKFSIQHSAFIIFDEGQRAVTPGQSIVFYQGEEVLGGGIID